MASEDSLIEVRRQKHQELNGGEYPLATDHSVSSVASFLHYIDTMVGEIPTTVVLDEARGNGTRILHGRIATIRKSGALTFIKLTDSTGSVQLVAARNNFTDYERFRLLDLGDIVEVIGEPVLTKTGERSLLLSEWKVLTKAHRPPPEKFVGLVDTELKYRKRYLDLMSSEETRARFVIRTYVLRAIRCFMDSNEFLEVETPTLATISSGANAKPFTTHHNALDIKLNLRIAPELNLKRLLVGGMDRVYEIGRSYRNEGIDTRHNPEFTMMEGYQAYGRFEELIIFTQRMLGFINGYLLDHLPKPVLTIYKRWSDERSFSLVDFDVVTMIGAVMRACRDASISLGIKSHTDANEFCFEDEIFEIKINDFSNERIQKIDVKGMYNALFDYTTTGEKVAVLFEYVAEPFLTQDYRNPNNGKSNAVFVLEYPKEISPLARANDRRKDTVDRFELFVDGRELANAFQELNNPDEQAVRFQEQLDSNQKDAMAFDADYIEALEYGMPPAIGFGMGIDRLVMLITNTSSIKDVILFPTLRPEK